MILGFILQFTSMLLMMLATFVFLGTKERHSSKHTVKFLFFCSLICILNAGLVVALLIARKAFT